MRDEHQLGWPCARSEEEIVVGGEEEEEEEEEEEGRLLTVTEQKLPPVVELRSMQTWWEPWSSSCA
jgi:hypothetical protein